jgi:hypothetical protein
MQKIPNTTKVHALLLDKHVAKLNEIGARFKIRRSEALRLVVETGLETYSFYESFGIVKMAEVTKRVRSAMEKDMQPSIFESIPFD